MQREPDAEHEEGGGQVDDEHGVEAADKVGYDAREDAAEDAVCVLVTCWRGNRETRYSKREREEKERAYLTALRMGMRYCASEGSIPCC